MCLYALIGLAAAAALPKRADMARTNYATMQRTDACFQVGRFSLIGDHKVANRTVLLNTTRGEIKFELYEDLAPITAQNFIDLTSSGFYDGLKFHRYEPGFVIQGGDPLGNGMGGSKTTIPLEVTPELKHDQAGIVAMARSNDPNSASSPFYITLAPATFLDMKYAVFGKVTSGLESALSLRAGDKITSATIIE